MLVVGIAALVAFIVTGFVTHGQSVVDAVRQAFGLR